MSNEVNDQEMRALLREAIARVKDTELRRDLWPQMLHML